MEILVFGDSITQGFHDEKNGGWCTQLANQAIETWQEKDISVFNLGISGDNTDDLASRIEVETKARADGDSVYIFAIGVNDSQFELSSGENRVSTDKYFKNIIECLSVAREVSSHAKVYFLEILPVVDEKLNPMPWKPTHGYSQKHVDKYNEILKEIAAAENVKIIQTNDLFGEEKNNFLPDGVHPNSEGHKLVFERVKSFLEAEKVI